MLTGLFLNLSTYRICKCWVVLGLPFKNRLKIRNSTLTGARKSNSHAVRSLPSPCQLFVYRQIYSQGDAQKFIAYFSFTASMLD